MQTYFAPAARADEDALQRDIVFASHNPVIDAVMMIVGGLVAVLNEQRQLLAVNEAFVKTLGIEDAERVLGLRPGEAVNCIHAHDHSGGCGTGMCCASCGAAISILTCLEKNQPVEKLCALTVEKNRHPSDVVLSVRACPLDFGDRRFIMLFLQDVTRHQWRSALERTFFHDINNTILGLQTAAQMLDTANDQKKENLVQLIKLISSRLTREVEIQRTLAHADPGSYQPVVQEVPVDEVFHELQALLNSHPAAASRKLILTDPGPDLRLQTDRTLLLRILTNMLVNAFEATEKDGPVRLWVEQTDALLIFCVWNSTAIPPDIRGRIFQRNFSTKPGEGRGLGTYAMKLFGEYCLHGRVDFTSSDEAGTLFRLSLPR